MDGDALNTLLASLGIVVAAIAAGIALHANCIAKKGNALARSANDTADDAVEEARAANNIAEGANSIAERALRVAQDDLPYNWVLRVDDNGSAWVINDCGYPAGQVNVVVDSDGQVISDSGPTDVAPFGELLFDLKDAVEQHLQQVRLRPYRPASSGNGLFVAGSKGKPFATVFRAHIRWLTDEQVPRSDVIEEVVRHHMTREGMKRLRSRN